MTRQLSDGDSGGTLIGQSATDKVGFYGVTPVAQRSGAAQAALTSTTARVTGAVGFQSTTAFNAAVGLLVEIRAALVAAGLIKGSA